MSFVVIEGTGKTRQCKVVRRSETLKEAQDYINKAIKLANRGAGKDVTFQILEQANYLHLKENQL
jgi:hypothetical protein